LTIWLLPKWQRNLARRLFKVDVIAWWGGGLKYHEVHLESFGIRARCDAGEVIW
jgi:hypothetical protein